MPLLQALDSSGSFWIMRTDGQLDSDGVGFSFEYSCAVLGLDSVWLREGLQRWREARVTRDIESSRGAAATL